MYVITCSLRVLLSGLNVRRGGGLDLVRSKSELLLKACGKVHNGATIVQNNCITKGIMYTVFQKTHFLYNFWYYFMKTRNKAIKLDKHQNLPCNASFDSELISEYDMYITFKIY